MDNLNIIKDKNLKEENTFRVESHAKYYTEAKSTEDLLKIVQEYGKDETLVIGGGSNILFTKDLKGLVIKIKIEGYHLIYENEKIIRLEIGAGEKWSNFVEYCINNNYGGVENLVLIPGTLGGAAIQNIGAYGAEFKYVFYSLRALHIETCEERVFTRSECKFDYRKSIFNSENKGEYIITYVTLELNKNPILNLNYKIVFDEVKNLNNGNNITIKDVSDVIKRIRMSKLPDHQILGNAGSFFKNPFIGQKLYEEIKEKFPNLPLLEVSNDFYKIPTAWLIENVGWKGKKENEVGSYMYSPGVLVNYGRATGEEILKFSNQIRKEVFNKFNVILEEEVQII